MKSDHRTVGKPLCQVTGIVQAPVDHVWRALVLLSPDLNGQGSEAVATARESQVIAVPVGQPAVMTVNVQVDPLNRQIVMQGQWWYRGVTSVEPDEDGSMVVRRVYNIAPGLSRWMVSLVHQHDGATFRAQHDLLLKAIGQRLNCRVWLEN